MESLRLRLVFKNNGILSETQNSQGLKKSWILVPQPQTQLKTVAALSAYIIQSFHLQQSCPHGLLLSMDGFVLPPFESTSILKDKDIISVKKKADVLAIEGNDAADEVEGVHIVDKQLVTTGALLLANEEFDKESGGYESDDTYDEFSEEDEDSRLDGNEYLEDVNDVSKKRKAPEKVQGPKKKKQRSEPPVSLADEVHIEPIERPQGNEVLLGKRELSKNDIQTNAGTNAKSVENVESTPNLKRHEQGQGNGNDMNSAPNASESTRKGPSRSARRKYKKRRWLREMAKIQKKSEDCESKEIQNWKQMQIKASETDGLCQPNRLKNWKQMQSKAGKRERRGQPKGLQNWKQMQSEAGKTEGLDQPKGLLHWTKFGRKDMTRVASNSEYKNQDHYTHGNSNKSCDTGNEVVPVVIRPGHIRFEPLEEEEAQQRQEPVENYQWNGITSKKMGQKWGRGESSVSRGINYEGSKEETEMDVEGHSHARKQMDVDKLAPLGGVPKEGDVIAFRLLQLSSSWTPELSSFRVGKVYWYDSLSCTVLLLPVPGYPFVSKNSDEDDTTDQNNDNLYNKQDKWLKIEFTSLIDVRIMRKDDLDPSASKETPGQADGGTGDGVNLWEQLSEAVNSKKDELSNESDWGKTHSSGNYWSQRALKGGSTLGPTMAYMRSERKYKK